MNSAKPFFYRIIIVRIISSINDDASEEVLAEGTEIVNDTVVWIDNIETGSP